MLTQEEAESFTDSVARVKTQVLHYLSKTKNTEQQIEFIGQLHRNLDALIEQTAQEPPWSECKKGCDYCCYGRRVEVSEPEAFYITKFLKALPDQQLARIKARLQKFIAAESEENHKSRPCAFLENHQCSIYAVRPAVCRKAHSLSVSACEKNEVQIPQKLSTILAAEALIAGTNQAYESHDLAINVRELNHAILAILSEENKAYY